MIGVRKVTQQLCKWKTFNSKLSAIKSPFKITCLIHHESVDTTLIGEPSDIFNRTVQKSTKSTQNIEIHLRKPTKTRDKMWSEMSEPMYSLRPTSYILINDCWCTVRGYPRFCSARFLVQNVNFRDFINGWACWVEKAVVVIIQMIKNRFQFQAKMRWTKKYLNRLRNYIYLFIF